jgi:hypothetical protein
MPKSKLTPEELNQRRIYGAAKRAAKRIGISLEEYQKQREAGMMWYTECKIFQPISEFRKDSHGRLKNWCNKPIPDKTSPKYLKQKKREEIDNLENALQVKCIKEDPNLVKQIKQNIMRATRELEELEKGA